MTEGNSNKKGYLLIVNYSTINKLLNNHARSNTAECMGKLMANQDKTKHGEINGQINGMGKLMANQDKTKLEFSAHPQMEQSLLTLAQFEFYNLQSANVKHRGKLS